MTVTIGRRELLVALGGGAAAAWPLAARGQQERMRRIGMLSPFSENDFQSRARLSAFHQGLQKLGWTEGSNLRIDARWFGGGTDDNRKNAAELIALAPDVILASGSATVGPLLQATRTVPIVFVIVPDPVGAGFVRSLARPGGNATGFTTFEYSIGVKWLELLKQIAPHVTRTAVIRDAAISAGIGQWGAIQAVAPSMGVELTPIDVSDAAEIERALAAFGQTPNSGLIGERVGSGSSRFDCGVGSPAQAACGIR